MHSAKGLADCFAFCQNAHQLLLEQPEEIAETLAWFFNNADEFYGYKKYNIPPADFTNKLDDYSIKYRKLIRSLIDFLSGKGYTEKLYYKKLWDSLENILADASPEEKGFCIFDILMDARTPYYELPVGLQLSPGEFKAVSDSIRPSIQQLNFAFGISKNQRQKTELTSHVVHLLDNLDNSKYKAVLLVHFLIRCEKLWNERKINENSNKTGGSVQADDKNKDTTFLPGSAQNNGDKIVLDGIIANYRYPDINENEFDFVLVKKGDTVFLSDQGKTLEQLDKIFQLDEPDVIKNLVAILRQYNAGKQGDEFVVKIDNWNGNTNENENEDLKKGILSLFACVSFMLNMKIFYS